MISSAAGRPPVLPTRAEFEHRRAELLAMKAKEAPPTQTPPVSEPPPPVDPVRSDPPGTLIGPELGPAALHGLAGLTVQTLLPHTEAHPAAILVQFFAAFGNLLGPGPHCRVDSTRHGLNLFVVLVGDSSKARKGTSWNQIRRLFQEVDQPWIENRITTARLTAGGLLYTLRDQEPPTDRRLLALSEEFASALHSVSRNGSQLSPLLRRAWDGGHLEALDGRRQLRASDAHISLIAHVTRRELARILHPIEAHNGFANRCLWTLAQRTQFLPEGGSLAGEDLSTLAAELRRVLDWAQSEPGLLFQRNEAARRLWKDMYPYLTQFYPGLYGAATSRAEAQVLRLSALYAALDCTAIIEPSHLMAAAFLWNYCSDSAALLFGTSTGCPLADRIREAIAGSPDGLSSKQISAIFHGHVSAEQIRGALDHLMSLRILSRHVQTTKGRPSLFWTARANDAVFDIPSALTPVSQEDGFTAEDPPHQET